MTAQIIRFVSPSASDRTAIAPGGYDKFGLVQAARALSASFERLSQQTKALVDSAEDMQGPIVRTAVAGQNLAPAQAAIQELPRLFPTRVRFG